MAGSREEAICSWRGRLGVAAFSRSGPSRTADWTDCFLGTSEQHLNLSPVVLLSAAQFPLMHQRVALEGPPEPSYLRMRLCTKGSLWKVHLNYSCLRMSLWPPSSLLFCVPVLLGLEPRDPCTLGEHSTTCWAMPPCPPFSPASSRLDYCSIPACGQSEPPLSSWDQGHCAYVDAALKLPLKTGPQKEMCSLPPVWTCWPHPVRSASYVKEVGQANNRIRLKQGHLHV